MFEKVFPIALKYHLFEEEHGQRRLVKSGEFVHPSAG
jgi:hypothetical protein